MNTKQLFKTALKSILHHKGRSILTTIGINIGIASIIAMLAIGHGAEQAIKNKILASGKNMIFVHSGSMTLDSQQKVLKRKHEMPLTTQDVQSIKSACPTIWKISPSLCQSVAAKFLNNIIAIQLKAGNQDLLAIFNRKIDRGIFFTLTQVEIGARVIVLGFKAAQELFKSINPIGQLVIINNVPFVVIGTIIDMQHQFQSDFQDANFDCFIPHTAFKKFIERSTSNTIKALSLSTKSYELIPDTVKQITKTLRMRHHLDIKDHNDFFIIDQQSLLNAAKSSSDVLTLFLLIIACISLLVGGIGVMNIMLVTVGERTEEIGIRMALGAPHKTILIQFIYEALMLCFVGGLLGVILGVTTPWVAGFFTGWTIVIKPITILVAFSAIFFVGILFGYYPALKASSLKLVEALYDR